MPAAPPSTTWRTTAMPTAKTGDRRLAVGGRIGHSPTAYRLPPTAWWWGVLPAVLALAGVAVFLRAQLGLAGNLWGVPLDDAYIHFRFAQNLAAGHGFSFNPDHPVPGSTSPLWVLLLAGAAVLGTPLWLAAKVYGVLFLAVAAVLAWRLALQLTGAPVLALATGALTALDGRLLWAAPSGMEVTLFAALSLAALLGRPTTQATGDRRQATGAYPPCGRGSSPGAGPGSPLGCAPACCAR
jgi:arabinofuranosyltransferase